ncbi:MAG TPA: class D sortase [Gemmatimonadaceae bacterium]|nr:class D sortase [Gemmatimonadaceae bacterium]
MRARALGLVCYAVGAALLLDVGVTYGRGVLKGDAARAAWDAAQAHRAVLATRRAARAAAVDRAALPIGVPVAQLRIPKIGLDEVVIEGVGSEQLNAAPGHLPGSALPGAPGNAVISAHRDRHFHRLGAVALGDTIITVTARGRVMWTVIGRRLVARGAPALFATIDATLTLTTCWPMRYIGPAPERLIVTARPIPASSR